MSGVVPRFKLKLGAAPAAIVHENSNDGFSLHGNDAMDIDKSEEGLPAAPGRVTRGKADELYPDTVDLVEIKPQHPPIITQRLALWDSSEVVPQDHVFWKFIAGLANIIGIYQGHDINAGITKDDTQLQFYFKSRALPRFAGRYQRAATALLAGWLYTASNTRRTQSGHVKLDSIVAVVEAYIEEILVMFPGLPRGDWAETPALAAQLAWDGLVRRCYSNALRFKRPKLAHACVTFLADIYIFATHLDNVPWRIKHAYVDWKHTLEKCYIPSLLTTSNKIFAHISALSSSSDTDYHRMLPSDIPVSAFDGSKADLFESDERVRYFLIAPKRVPLPMMAAPPTSHFAYATLPVDYDDYQMPSTLTNPNGTPYEHSAGASGEAGDNNFLQSARDKMATYVRTSKNFLARGPHYRSLLPLCAVSVLEQSQRDNGLRDEDRWWVSNFMSDTGSFDIEDLGSLFEKLAGHGEKHFGRFSQMMGHARHYPDRIKESADAGYAPLATPNCKAMQNRTFERSERRSAYCPFVSHNQASADEIRQLVEWQQVPVSEDDMSNILFHARNGEQKEACLAHYNALLKAQGAQAHEMRQKEIKRPPLFAHLQVMHRKTEPNANQF